MGFNFDEIAANLSRIQGFKPTEENTPAAAKPTDEAKTRDSGKDAADLKNLTVKGASLGITLPPDFLDAAGNLKPEKIQEAKDLLVDAATHDCEAGKAARLLQKAVSLAPDNQDLKVQAAQAWANWAKDQKDPEVRKVSLETGLAFVEGIDTLHGQNTEAAKAKYELALTFTKLCIAYPDYGQASLYLGIAIQNGTPEQVQALAQSLHDYPRPEIFPLLKEDLHQSSADFIAGQLIAANRPQEARDLYLQRAEEYKDKDPELSAAYKQSADLVEVDPAQDLKNLAAWTDEDQSKVDAVIDETGHYKSPQTMDEAKGRIKGQTEEFLHSEEMKHLKVGSTDYNLKLARYLGEETEFNLLTPLEKKNFLEQGFKIPQDPYQFELKNEKGDAVAQYFNIGDKKRIALYLRFAGENALGLGPSNALPDPRIKVMDRIKESIRFFNKSLELNPDGSKCRLEAARSLTLMSQGDVGPKLSRLLLEQAKQNLVYIAHHDLGANWEVMQALGDNSLAMGHAGEARDNYLEAINLANKAEVPGYSLDPNHPEDFDNTPLARSLSKANDALVKTMSANRLTENTAPSEKLMDALMSKGVKVSDVVAWNNEKNPAKPIKEADVVPGNFVQYAMGHRTQFGPELEKSYGKFPFNEKGELEAPFKKAAQAYLDDRQKKAEDGARKQGLKEGTDDFKTFVDKALGEKDRLAEDYKLLLQPLDDKDAEQVQNMYAASCDAQAILLEARGQSLAHSDNPDQIQQAYQDLQLAGDEFSRAFDLKHYTNQEDLCNAAKSYYQAGMLARRGGNEEQAKQLFLKGATALQFGGTDLLNNPEALKLFGDGLMQAGEYEKAVQAYNNAREPYLQFMGKRGGAPENLDEQCRLLGEQCKKMAFTKEALGDDFFDEKMGLDEKAAKGTLNPTEKTRYDQINKGLASLKQIDGLHYPPLGEATQAGTAHEPRAVTQLRNDMIEALKNGDEKKIGELSKLVDRQVQNSRSLMMMDAMRKEAILPQLPPQVQDYIKRTHDWSVLKTEYKEGDGTPKDWNKDALNNTPFLKALREWDEKNPDLAKQVRDTLEIFGTTGIIHDLDGYEDLDKFNAKVEELEGKLFKTDENGKIPLDPETQMRKLEPSASFKAWFKEAQELDLRDKPEEWITNHLETSRNTLGLLAKNDQGLEAIKKDFTDTKKALDEAKKSGDTAKSQALDQHLEQLKGHIGEFRSNFGKTLQAQSDKFSDDLGLFEAHSKKLGKLDDNNQYPYQSKLKGAKSKLASLSTDFSKLAADEDPEKILDAMIADTRQMEGSEALLLKGLTLVHTACIDNFKSGEMQTPGGPTAFGGEDAKFKTPKVDDVKVEWCTEPKWAEAMKKLDDEFGDLGKLDGEKVGTLLSKHLDYLKETDKAMFDDLPTTLKKGLDAQLEQLNKMRQQKADAGESTWEYDQVINNYLEAQKYLEKGDSDHALALFKTATESKRRSSVMKDFENFQENQMVDGFFLEIGLITAATLATALTAGALAPEAIAAVEIGTASIMTEVGVGLLEGGLFVGYDLAMRTMLYEGKEKLGIKTVALSTLTNPWEEIRGPQDLVYKVVMNAGMFKALKVVGEGYQILALGDRALARAGAMTLMEDASSVGLRRGMGMMRQLMQGEMAELGKGGETLIEKFISKSGKAGYHFGAFAVEAGTMQAWSNLQVCMDMLYQGAVHGKELDWKTLNENLDKVNSPEQVEHGIANLIGLKLGGFGTHPLMEIQSNKQIAGGQKARFKLFLDTKEQFEVRMGNEMAKAEKEGKPFKMDSQLRAEANRLLQMGQETFDASTQLEDKSEGKVKVFDAEDKKNWNDAQALLLQWVDYSEKGDPNAQRNPPRRPAESKKEVEKKTSDKPLKIAANKGPQDSAPPPEVGSPPPATPPPASPKEIRLGAGAFIEADGSPLFLDVREGNPSVLRRGGTRVEVTLDDSGNPRLDLQEGTLQRMGEKGWESVEKGKAIDLKAGDRLKFGDEELTWQPPLRVIEGGKSGEKLEAGSPQDFIFKQYSQARKLAKAVGKEGDAEFQKDLAKLIIGDVYRDGVPLDASHDDAIKIRARAARDFAEKHGLTENRDFMKSLGLLTVTDLQAAEKNDFPRMLSEDEYVPSKADLEKDLIQDFDSLDKVPRFADFDSGANALLSLIQKPETAYDYPAQKKALNALRYQFGDDPNFQKRLETLGTAIKIAEDHETRLNKDFEASARVEPRLQNGSIRYVQVTGENIDGNWVAKTRTVDVETYYAFLRYQDANLPLPRFALDGETRTVERGPKYQDAHGNLWKSEGRAKAWSEMMKTHGASDQPITREDYVAAYTKANGEAPSVADLSFFDKKFKGKYLDQEGHIHDRRDARDAANGFEEPLPSFPLVEDEPPSPPFSLDGEEKKITPEPKFQDANGNLWKTQERADAWSQLTAELGGKIAPPLTDEDYIRAYTKANGKAPSEEDLAFFNKKFAGKFLDRNGLPQPNVVYRDLANTYGSLDQVPWYPDFATGKEAFMAMWRTPELALNYRTQKNLLNILEVQFGKDPAFQKDLNSLRALTAMNGDKVKSLEMGFQIGSYVEKITENGRTVYLQHSFPEIRGLRPEAKYPTDEATYHAYLNWGLEHRSTETIRQIFELNNPGRVYDKEAFHQVSEEVLKQMLKDPAGQRALSPAVLCKMTEMVFDAVHPMETVLQSLPEDDLNKLRGGLVRQVLDGKLNAEQAVNLADKIQSGEISLVANDKAEYGYDLKVNEGRTVDHIIDEAVASPTDAKTPAETPLAKGSSTAPADVKSADLLPYVNARTTGSDTKETLISWLKNNPEELKTPEAKEKFFEELRKGQSGEPNGKVLTVANGKVTVETIAQVKDRISWAKEALPSELPAPLAKALLWRTSKMAGGSKEDVQSQVKKALQDTYDISKIGNDLPSEVKNDLLLRCLRGDIRDYEAKQLIRDYQSTRANAETLGLDPKDFDQRMLDMAKNSLEYANNPSSTLQKTIEGVSKVLKSIEGLKGRISDANFQKLLQMTTEGSLTAAQGHELVLESILGPVMTRPNGAEDSTVREIFESNLKNAYGDKLPGMIDLAGKEFRSGRENFPVAELMEKNYLKPGDPRLVLQEGLAESVSNLGIRSNVLANFGEALQGLDAPTQAAILTYLNVQLGRQEGKLSNALNGVESKAISANSEKIVLDLMNFAKKLKSVDPANREKAVTVLQGKALQSDEMPGLDEVSDSTRSSPDKTLPEGRIPKRTQDPDKTSPGGRAPQDPDKTSPGGRAPQDPDKTAPGRRFPSGDPKVANAKDAAPPEETPPLSLKKIKIEQDDSHLEEAMAATVSPSMLAPTVAPTDLPKLVSIQDIVEDKSNKSFKDEGIGFAVQQGQLGVKSNDTLLVNGVPMESNGQFIALNEGDTILVGKQYYSRSKGRMVPIAGPNADAKPFGEGGMGKVLDNGDGTLSKIPRAVQISKDGKLVTINSLDVEQPALAYFGRIAANDPDLQDFAPTLIGRTAPDHLLISKIPGESLSAIVARDGKAPEIPAQAWDAFEANLKKLRDAGLCHGDINPGNILWDGKKLRLIDFGEARLGVKSDSDLKRFGRLRKIYEKSAKTGVDPSTKSVFISQPDDFANEELVPYEGVPFHLSEPGQGKPESLAAGSTRTSTATVADLKPPESETPPPTLPSANQVQPGTLVLTTEGGERILVNFLEANPQKVRIAGQNCEIAKDRSGIYHLKPENGPLVALKEGEAIEVSGKTFTWETAKLEKTKTKESLSPELREEANFLAGSDTPFAEPAKLLLEGTISIDTYRSMQKDIGQGFIDDHRVAFDDVMDFLTQLSQDPGLHVSQEFPPKGRMKAPSDIGPKLFRRKAVDLNPITDFGGTRIIVESNDDVEAILGKIQEKYTIREAYTKEGEIETDLMSPDQMKGQGIEQEDGVVWIHAKMDKDDIHRLVEGHPSSGYRALHIVVEVDGKPVEIQIKTAAMHEWGEIEHSLVYKAKGIPEETLKAIKDYRKAVADYLAKVTHGEDPGERPTLPILPKDTPNRTDLLSKLIEMDSLIDKYGKPSDRKAQPFLLNDGKRTPTPVMIARTGKSDLDGSQATSFWEWKVKKITPKRDRWEVILTKGDSAETNPDGFPDSIVTSSEAPNFKEGDVVLRVSGGGGSAFSGDTPKEPNQPAGDWIPQQLFNVPPTPAVSGFLPIMELHSVTPHPDGRDFTIGRNQGDLKFDSQWVSSVHCVIHKDESTGQYYLFNGEMGTDKVSFNGIIVNGKPMEGLTRKSVPLKDGDIFCIAGAYFQFRVPRAPVAEVKKAAGGYYEVQLENRRYSVSSQPKIGNILPNAVHGDILAASPIPDDPQGRISVSVRTYYPLDPKKGEGMIVLKLKPEEAKELGLPLTSENNVDVGKCMGLTLRLLPQNEGTSGAPPPSAPASPPPPPPANPGPKAATSFEWSGVSYNLVSFVQGKRIPPNCVGYGEVRNARPSPDKPGFVRLEISYTEGMQPGLPVKSMTPDLSLDDAKALGIALTSDGQLAPGSGRNFFYLSLAKKVVPDKSPVETPEIKTYEKEIPLPKLQALWDKYKAPLKGVYGGENTRENSAQTRGAFMPLLRILHNFPELEANFNPNQYAEASRDLSTQKAYFDRLEKAIRQDPRYQDSAIKDAVEADLKSLKEIQKPYEAPNSSEIDQIKSKYATELGTLFGRASADVAKIFAGLYKNFPELEAEFNPKKLAEMDEAQSEKFFNRTLKAKLHPDRQAFHKKDIATQAFKEASKIEDTLKKEKLRKPQPGDKSQAPLQWDLDSSKIYRVGRKGYCEIKIVDEMISSEHFVIRWELGFLAWTVTDSNSTNGTFVNGQRLSNFPPRPVILKPGDIIQAGSTTLQFVIENGQNRLKAIASE